MTDEDLAAMLEPTASVSISDEKPVADSRIATLKAAGNELLGKGDTTGAVGAYREAIALLGDDNAHPDAGALHSNLAQALLKMNLPEEALAAAEACVGTKPDWHKAHYRKGDALFALRRFEEALAAYKASLKLSATATHEVSRAVKLAEEALKGGVFFKQLLPGRDIAVSPNSQEEGLVFGAAAQMKNLIYLVGDLTSRECYVVDACWDPQGIAAVAASHKMTLVGAIASHYHFDHTGGAIPPPFVAMVYGPMGKPNARLPGLHEMGRHHGAKLYCHSLERERLAKQCELRLDELLPLEQGSKLPLGAAGMALEILHTPGHSGGSICIQVSASGPRSYGVYTQSVLTGDTVFPGSCGRLDLPDSDKSAMYDSLQRLRELDDSVAVYPGHAYSGERSTVGQEKKQGLLRAFGKQQWLSMHG